MKSFTAIVKKIYYTSNYFSFLVSLAAAIPNIELFISLVGALCVSMLALVFPSLLETSVFWNQKKGCSFAFMFVKNLFITLFGLFGLAVGFSISLKDIIEKVF